MQRPTVWMALQEAFVPHWASAAFWSLIGSDGEHSSAQYLSPDWSWRMAAGVMVQPAGVSVGHLPPVAAGEHTEPATPVMVILSTVEDQGTCARPQKVVVCNPTWLLRILIPSHQLTSNFDRR